MGFEEAYKNYLIYASKQHKKQSFDTLKYKFELRVLPFFKISSIRKIRIDKVLKNDLLSLKKYYEKVYNKSDFDYFVFGGIKPLSPSTINRRKIDACKKANLRSITLHQFRHSHATLLLHNGIIINEISRRLGHSNPSITLNIYTHTDLSQEKRVSSTLNSLRFNLFNTLKYKFKQFISIITR